MHEERRRMVRRGEGMKKGRSKEVKEGADVGGK